MPSKELIEKVARAIFETWRDENKSDATWEELLSMQRRDGYMEGKKIYDLASKEAKAAISTILDALQEPTEGMILSYEEYMNETKIFSRPHGAHVWRALLNASPLGEQSE